MAKARLLNKVIILSEKINKISEGAENLYYRILVTADDFGRYHAKPEIIKGQIYTLRRVSTVKIKQRLSELGKVGLIKLYKSNGEFYLEIIDFEKYQKFRSDIKQKAEYPKPGTDSDVFDTGCNDKEDSGYRNRNRNNNINENKNKDVDILTPIDEIQLSWNQFATKNNLSEIRGIIKNSTREGHVKARLSDDNFNFNKLLKAIEKQPFLLGQNKTGFSVTFDWILLPSNYQKIIEGNYLDRKQKFKGIKEWLNEP